MPFSRENGILPLHRFLKLNIDLPLEIFKQSSAIDLQWSGRHSDAAVVMRLAVVSRREMQGQEALLLDIDYAKESKSPGFHWSEIAVLVEEARRTCRQIFEDMITDEYRSYLRGEIL